MKNIMKLGFITLSFAALGGCSTISSTLGWGESSSDTNAKTPEVIKAPEVSSDSSAATAKVSLKNNKDKIVATIYTSYNNNPEGSVKLQWKAPKGTSCYDTSFPITKYGKKNDKTWASVGIKQGKKLCKGDWTANIIFDKKVIATDTILVS